MSDASTLTRPAEGMKLAVSSAKDAHYVPGRRHFFQYRDLASPRRRAADEGAGDVGKIGHGSRN